VRLVERVLRTHRLLKVDFKADYDQDGNRVEEEVEDAAEASVVSSEFAGQIGRGLHRILLDLDVQAELIPSSTEGHSHLYINLTLTWEKYKNLLVALGEAGILEQGYVHVSLKREATYLRLPGVKKEAA
jgi:hypothetical protein